MLQNEVFERDNCGRCMTMGGLPLDISACNGRVAGTVNALRLLRTARHYAEQLSLNPWDFAEEISSLRHLGLSNGDLRWLICKQFVEHGRESTKAGAEHREFKHVGGLRFSKKSCFVITDAGLAYLADDLQQRRIAEPPPKPRWDRDLQELRLGQMVVKQFKVPAPNQEMVLAVFEEEGWPVCIDDPLTPSDEIDPKRRLHDTINSLNRNQKTNSIRFHGNGSGNGVRWELAQSNEQG